MLFVGVAATLSGQNPGSVPNLEDLYLRPYCMTHINRDDQSRGKQHFYKVDQPKIVRHKLTLDLIAVASLLVHARYVGYRVHLHQILEQRAYKLP